MPTAPMRLVSQADKGAEAGRIQKRDAGQVDYHLDHGRAEGLHELAEGPHGVRVERSLEGQNDDPLAPLTCHGESGHTRLLLGVLRRPEEVIGGGHGALPRRASRVAVEGAGGLGWPSLSVGLGSDRGRGGKPSIALRGEYSLSGRSRPRWHCTS